VGKIESIGKIRKKHRNEWLLIRVAKFDKATTTPLTGRLLAHNADRDAIYKKSLSHKGMIFIDHSSDKLPKGYAVAF
jgi:hypothetical protein